MDKETKQRLDNYENAAYRSTPYQSENLTSRDPLTELDNLAHQIALDSAVCDIVSNSRSVKNGRISFLEVCPVEGAESQIGKSMRYLELRGALIRHPRNPDLFRLMVQNE